MGIEYITCDCGCGHNFPDCIGFDYCNGCECTYYAGCPGIVKTNDEENLECIRCTDGVRYEPSDKDLIYKACLLLKMTRLELVNLCKNSL